MMKNLFIGISVLCFAAFGLSACSNNELSKEVLTYDLLDVKKEMTLRLSDLVEDIRMIPLETKPDVLISDGDYRVNDKYIVTIGGKAIHQFDARTGKYIRLLAVAGGGPKEYYSLKSYFIANDKLYYSMAGKKNLYVIDLNTGEHLQPYATKYEYLEFAEITEGEELYVANDSLLFERYHFKTHEKTPLMNPLRCLIHRDKKYMISPGFGSQLLSGVGVWKNQKEVFYFNQKYSDTLYVQGAKYAEPYACFRFPIDNTQIPNKVGFPTGKYFALKILYVDAREIFCNVFELNSVLNDRSFVTETEPRGLYCIDRETGVASVVTKYIFDPLFEVEFTEGGMEEGRQYYMGNTVFGFINYVTTKDSFAKAIPAHQVKKYLRMSLENPNLPDSKKVQLRELDRQLTDESNPVVFIGKKCH